MTDNPDLHMDSRREFLRKLAVVVSGGSYAGLLTASVQRALAINPDPGSTFFDAEHVVILMQENRSFDHVYGCLKGVRGFNDPRAVSLPNGNPVWFQTDASGTTYTPFRLDMRNSKATWMGELPHGRKDQLDAYNGGRHDRWLIAKTAEDKAYRGVPLSLGYYTRGDLPFHYALADAFTVCDQAFCSVLGPTIPNRLYLWTGTVWEKKPAGARAHVQNEDTDFGAEVSWKTFPERLEENGVSWRVYQNELAVPSGLEGDHDAWLSNFGDNPLEFFSQYGVYYAEPHRRFLEETCSRLSAQLAELDALEYGPAPDQGLKRVKILEDLSKARADLVRWSAENFRTLGPVARALHERAFTTNRLRLDYRELGTMTYKDGGIVRSMSVPKGDVLHQFREDVRTGRLPTVSWIVPPERLSDHPSNPWYGALCLSEAMEILTQNPDVWKKTIFILCYDENDGYFDHIPPFIPPRTDCTGTGKASSGIDTSDEFVLEGRLAGGPNHCHRDGPIGLGYRVPLVIASPWTRGGYACSEVFDHTSIVRFLETFLSEKTGRAIEEKNISAWRRSVCGNLCSAFRPYAGEAMPTPMPIHRETFLAEVNRAQFQPVPNTFHAVAAESIRRSGLHWVTQDALAPQENGVRPSCVLPYDLHVHGRMAADSSAFEISFRAGTDVLVGPAAGAPFHVYAPVATTAQDGKGTADAGRTWAYAVAPGDELVDRWPLSLFRGDGYVLRVHGPNGFFREFRGGRNDPGLRIALAPLRDENSGSANARLTLVNMGLDGSLDVLVSNISYGRSERKVRLGPAGSPDATNDLMIPLNSSGGWYDFSVQVCQSALFAQRFAGRIEQEIGNLSDPLMGGLT